MACKIRQMKTCFHSGVLSFNIREHLIPIPKTTVDKSNGINDVCHRCPPHHTAVCFRRPP
jgi:hypothetical protein